MSHLDRSTRAIVEQASQKIQAAHVEPSEDARCERAKATFRVEELAAFMNDGEEKLKRRCAMKTKKRRGEGSNGVNGSIDEHAREGKGREPLECICA